MITLKKTRKPVEKFKKEKKNSFIVVVFAYIDNIL